MLPGLLLLDRFWQSTRNKEKKIELEHNGSKSVLWNASEAASDFAGYQLVAVSFFKNNVLKAQL